MARVTRVLNVEKLRAKCVREKKRTAANFEKGVERAGTQLLRNANYYVPVDTGDLRKSGHKTMTGRGLKASVSVTYETDYALIVHEDLEAAHGQEFNIKHAHEIAAGRTHARRPQERAKWLTTALTEDRARYLFIIERELQKR